MVKAMWIPPRASRPQLAVPDVDLEAAGEPWHAGGDQDRDDGQQPDVIEQMNARILPDRARNQLGAVDVRLTDITYCSAGCVATAALLRLTGPLPKLLLSRNGCDCTFGRSGGWKSSTCSAKAWARSTWLRRRFGESPITSMPLNFGSMMVLSTAVLTLCGSPSTKARP